MDRKMWAFITEISIKNNIKARNIVVRALWEYHMTGEAAISLLYFTISFINSTARTAQLV
jgi:hypothetical protein